MAKQVHNLDQLNSATFEQAYPFIAEWVTTQGWIEIGQIDGMSTIHRSVGRGWRGLGREEEIQDAR